MKFTIVVSKATLKEQALPWHDLVEATEGPECSILQNLVQAIEGQQDLV